MPGPIVHQEAMTQCAILLKLIGIPLIVGDKLSVMEPELQGHHGFDFLTGDGNTFGLQEEYFWKIKMDFQDCNKDLSKLNTEVFSKDVRFLCHFTTDAYSIGQISSEFWGSKSDLFDIVSEFIINKKIFPVFLTSYKDKDHLLSTELNIMRTLVYDAYHNWARRWTFPFSRGIKNMVRNAVRFGAEFTASWVKLAWDTA
jgi:hypothetical protein